MLHHHDLIRQAIVASGNPSAATIIHQLQEFLRLILWALNPENLLPEPASLLSSISSGYCWPSSADAGSKESSSSFSVEPLFQTISISITSELHLQAQECLSASFVSDNNLKLCCRSQPTALYLFSSLYWSTISQCMDQRTNLRQNMLNRFLIRLMLFMLSACINGPHSWKHY